MYHDVEYIESISPGRLGQRFSEESSRMVNGLGPELGLMFRAVASMVTGAIIGLTYDWKVTLLVFIALPVIFFFGKMYQSYFSNAYEITMKEHQEVDTISEETFRNIKTVASLGAESSIAGRCEKIIRNCCSYMMRANIRGGEYYCGMIASNQLSFAYLFIISILIIYNQRIHYPQLLFNAGCSPDLTSSVDVCFNTLISLNETCQSLCSDIEQCWYHDGSQCLVGGEVITIMMAVVSAFPSFGNSFSALVSLAKSRMSASFFLDVIDHKDEMNIDNQSGVRPESNKGDIEFKDIDFKYASRDTQVLNHLNLTIHEDEMLGIVGESGSGKSTILKLLMQLYAPSAGTITWNGVDTKTIDVHWLRENISYVAQEPVLFSGTIRENLMYGRVGCTKEEMIEAAKLVDADGFIRSFPNGYDTHVGELGTSLSGGQKQRIAIARALLRRPRILVLDEATSALDTQTEAIVQRAVEAIRAQNKANGGSLSIVVVAHRLSTIRSCDRIVVVDEGHVVEEGTHEELLNKKGVYAALYESQETTSSAPVTPVEEHQTENGEKEGEEKTEEDTEEEYPHVSMNQLLAYVPRYAWTFWVGFIGNFFRVVYPPTYSYAVSQMQELLYAFDLKYFMSRGWMCVWLIVLACVSDVFGTMLHWIMTSILGENLIAELRVRLLRKYLSMQMAFFDEPKHFPAVLTSRVGIECRRIRDIQDQSGMIVENYMIAIVNLIMCFSPLGSWRLALVALVMTPFLLSVGYLQYMVVGRTTELIDSDLTKESGVITDYLLNIHTVRAYGLEDTLLKSIDKDMKPADEKTKTRMIRQSIGQFFTQLIPCVYVIVMLSIGSLFMNKGWITFTQLLFVYMTVSTSASTASFTIAFAASLKLARKAADTVVGILGQTSEDDAAREIKTEGQNGDITFKDVSFTYPTRPEAPILKSVSFTIPQGKSVAFVGPSGCGKSTMISLIQRLYKPLNGTIELAGVNVETLNLDWYRAQLGAVNQEPCMLSGTIRENLQLGVDHELSEEELEEACKQALCLDFINEMPDRFETDLGAVGKAVSGGQKQRLALARAILRKPSILLLDEATSALDSENQEKFLTALDAWRKTYPCTVVTVAHRLSTIVDSDIIFVVHEGEIIASGTHEELLSNCDFYANLVRGQ